MNRFKKFCVETFFTNENCIFFHLGLFPDFFGILSIMILCDKLLLRVAKYHNENLVIFSLIFF